MASLKYEILLLDRNTRFVLWQIKIQVVLVQMDLEDALLGIDKMPSTLIDEEKKRKDQKALTQLHLHLSNEILQDVMKEKTAAALWKRLEQICMSKTLTSKLHMKQCLYAYRLEEGADTILYSRESLTIDEVYDSLTSYDKMKHLVVKPDSQGKSLIARGRQDQNKKGYIKSEYYKLQNKIKREAINQKRKQPKNFGEADVVEEYSDGELLVASVNDSKASEEWILDLGCTFHMSPNRDWFTTYDTVSEGVVLIRNNASCKIAGVGTIKIKMFDGVVKTLSDVRHVPKLKRNLISLSTLNSKGYRYTAESGVLKISKGSLVVMKGQRKTTKLYVLQGSTVTSDAAVTSFSLSDDDITKRWHMRLGHMSENGMVELSKRGLLDGQGICKLNFYEHCVFGKQKRKSLGALPEAEKLCKSEGIVRHLTVHHIPQQNGVAEQMNRTIMEKAEAASTTCFLINRSPSVAIEKKTPQEVWFGNPANYSDLKIFGCHAYAHIDNGKLEPRSIKCVFLGYKAELTPQASTKIENRVASSPQYSIAKNRTRREIKPPQKYAEADLVTYALNVAKDIDANREPSNYSEDPVKLPKDKKFVRCKCEFKKKEETPRVEEPRYKAKLVAKGYSQIPRVDFTDVFSPVVKHSSIRALLGIVAMHDLELEQLDSVKSVSTPLAAHFRLSSALSPQSNDEIEYISHVPYSSAMGSLMYATVCSRPDLSYAVNAVSKYMANLDKEHWKAVQWILRYLRALDRRRSLTGYVFTIEGCAISWKATLQTTVALSTTEAEYMAITEACKEAIWLKGLFSELNEDLQISTVFCDS
ncbi:hypothetical protein CXB51_028117 [Gossypium anomalum]|uniref:Integrase catalytic domain-containing protein n=1 Tax=Gossypium anomalum TaxID=47600 RepID=A0A8J6CN23_9ROSI|nr:hypothetical protein CXB51_028117 [Gossypium anomalum]